jgi:hypothetical protein
MRLTRWIGIVLGIAFVAGCGNGQASPADDGGDHADTMDTAPTCGDGTCASGEDCVSCAADCGACSEIIPAERRIDWDPGIPGGIPARDEICANVRDAPYSARGDGTADDTAAIQAALDDCPPQQVVYIPSGTYRVTDVLTITDSITVRGDGPGRTVIDAHGSEWTGVIVFGPGVDRGSGAVANITGGATKGSTSITLDDAGAVAVGDYLELDQLNDPAFVTIAGYEGDCTWCSREDGARAMGQLVEVTAVDAGTSTVTFTPPLYWTYTPSLEPQALPFAMGLKWAGVEDLTVRCNETGYRTNFMMAGCAYCWLRHVEGDYTDGDHADILSSFRCEVRDSYFHDAFHRLPGQTDTDVFLASKTTATLVENNVFWRLHTGVMLNWGAAGNAIAYNFFRSMFAENAPNCVFPDLSNHGAHPMFNLYEGNVGIKLAPDGIWGSSSHGTAFRNWLGGWDRTCEPLSGRAPVDTSACWTTFQQVYVINLDFASTSYNVVGNILGSANFGADNCFPYYGTTDGCQNIPPAEYMIVAPDDESGYETPYIFRLGYAGSGESPRESARPFETLLNHGNWDWVTRSVTWDPDIPGRTLPASLFHASKPAWFGDRPWPPIDPLGGAPEAIEPTVIPAGYRFINGTDPPGS